jgi:hypothetical protein
MARNTHHLRLTPPELHFWERAFLAAEKSLLSSHDGRLADGPGLIRLCREIAQQSVEARRVATRVPRRTR